MFWSSPRDAGCSQKRAHSQRQAAYRRGRRMSLDSMASTLHENRVRAELATMLEERTINDEVAVQQARRRRYDMGPALSQTRSRNLFPQDAALIECESQPARKLLLCGIDAAETNLKELASAPIAKDRASRVVAHVVRRRIEPVRRMDSASAAAAAAQNCLGAAAVSACRKEYERACLLPHVLALNAKDEEGHAMIQAHLATFLEFLRSVPDGPVLVHCVEGRNRSATLVIAWLVVEGRLPLTAAVRKVFERRPIVLTNRSFLEQLIVLAKEHNLFS